MFANFLSQLYYFWLAAKTGSFTQAAKEAFVSQSAISHQIILLEGKLNTHLFDRKKDGVHLTPEGQQLFGTCEMIFSELEKNTARLASGDISGVLNIAAPYKLGNLIVVDTIKNLLNKHSHIEPVLHVDSKITRFTSWNADVVLNYFPLQMTGLVNLPIVCNKYLIAASDKYLKSSPPIKSAQDIFNHTLITINEDLPDWRTFIKGTGMETRLRNVKKISAGNIEAAMMLAEADYGLVFTADFILNEAIKLNKLKVVSLKQPSPWCWIFLILRKQANLNPRVNAFLECFKDTIVKFKGEYFKQPLKTIEFIDKFIKGEEIDTDTIFKSCPPAAYSHYEGYEVVKGDEK